MAVDGAAWLGFGGVVVGAAVGYASSTVQESARRRHERRQALAMEAREDRIRFENRRFDAYVAVMAAANGVYAAAKHPPVQRHDASDEDAFMAQLNVAYERFIATLSPAFLLATSGGTRDRLAALVAATRDLFEEAGTTPGAALPHRAFSSQRASVKAAEAAMRVEFGLVPAPVAQPGE